MDSVFIIFCVFILLILIIKYGYRGNTTDFNNMHRPNKKRKPIEKESNDKIVIVKYIQYDYLIRAINQFCNLYNQENYIVLPRLYQHYYLFVITFPYNIDFDKFCLFINYLLNANEVCDNFDYQPNVTAWCTIQDVDKWATIEILNKELIMMIPESNTKQDRLTLTTHENVGYKIDNSRIDSQIKPDTSGLKYESIPIDLNLLKFKKFIDFN